MFSIRSVSKCYMQDQKWLSKLGGVSDETVKYGREFCGTWTQE
jgi:hypothetical protein